MPPPLIALEIHDVSLWEPSRVLPIVETMEQWGYNALVLHQNDLLDACTQLGLAANYGVSDLRLKKTRNNTAWLNRLCARLAKFGARLFLEIKEPSYHDYALELYPGLHDPSDPAWPEFCRRKTRDLLERVPGLGGLIINLSSPESRVSMPDHVAMGDHGLDRETWFDAMIAAFQQPLESAGKALYIRDFSYTADMQSDVLAAIERTNGEVGASIKITAHDYFPEFPQNPAAKNFDGKLIFEFEAFGEHMGWGVIPNCRVEEFRQRMEGYRTIGAGGFLMRISWEAIRGANALDSLGAVNVHALPRLITQDIDAAVLVRDWLGDAHGVTGMIAEGATDLLLKSWEIPAASYWAGEVFPRHSCLPSSWQEGWLSMDTNGMGARDHNPKILKNDPRLSETSREKLFARKEAATNLARQLAEKAKALLPDLPPALAAHFSAFQWLPFFAQQFELATKATFCAARGTKKDIDQLPGLTKQLLALANELERKFDPAHDIPHHHRMLLSPEQIQLFTSSLPAME